MPRVRVHALSHVEKGERHPSERFIFYKNGFAKTKTKAKKQTQRVCHERSPPRSLVSSGACAVWPRLGQVLEGLQGHQGYIVRATDLGLGLWC